MAAKMKNDNFDKVVSIDPTKPTINAIELNPIPKTATAKRDEKGRFLKGFSGNPHAWATRKLNTPLALLCRKKVETWVDVLDSLITSPSVDLIVKLGALKLGFEYGYGKPLQGSEVRQYETTDYNNFIKYLTHELHKQFNFNEVNVVEDEHKIKAKISRLIENRDMLNKVFEDVLKYAGSCSSHSLWENIW